jgi:hypothetical protein
MLFLIGPLLAGLIHALFVRQSTLQSQKSRTVDLLLLAALTYSIVLVSVSFITAEGFYYLNTWRYKDNCSSCDYFGDYPLEWEIEKKPMIIRELVAEILLLPLSANTCFSSDPQICEFASRPSRQSSFAAPMKSHIYIKGLALIPAVITFGSGMRFSRK